MVIWHIHQLFLRGIKKYSPLLLVVLLFSLAGCGGDDLEEPRYYNPISPLPLRVDVMPTPTVSSTSPSGQNLTDQQAPSQEEIGQSTPTPSPTPNNSPPPLETPTPGTKSPTEEDRSLIKPSPTPTPVPSPLEKKPTPLPDSQKIKATPTLTPSIVTPIPTETPRVAKDRLQNTKKAEESIEENIEDSEASVEDSEDLVSSNETDATQSAKQTGLKEDSEPIVTPSGIILNRISVCSEVLNREPVNCGDTFSLSKVNRIYTWMKISGVNPPKVLKHVYYWEGEVISTVKLTLNYTSMRTWSQKTFNPAQALGKWKVVVTTEEDKVITVKEFTVVP
jgi:hypothetical protein